MPKGDVLFNYSYGRVIFTTATDRDYTDHIITVGLRGDITAKLSSTFQVGYLIRTPDSSSQTGFSGLFLAGDTTYRPTERTTITLSTQRTTQESTFGTGAFYVTTNATLSATQQILPKLTRTARLGGGINDYSTKQIGGREDRLARGQLPPGRRAGRLRHPAVAPGRPRVSADEPGLQFPFLPLRGRPGHGTGDAPVLAPHPPSPRRGRGVVRLTSGRSPPKLAALHVKHPMVRSFLWSAWLLAALTLSVWLPSPALGQEYTIGPRDVLAITVWGQADLSRDYPVDPDGFVSFPLIGRVKAAGSTPKQLAAQLTELLEKDYLVNPQVIVSVKEYLSQKVQVLGEAEKPGVYYLTGPTSVLEILSKAGGLASTAGKQVVLLRNHPAAAAGTASAEPGPAPQPREDPGGGPGREHPRAGPGHHHHPEGADEHVLRLRRGQEAGGLQLDKETNILEGITIAGGFTDKAAPGRTRVIRKTPPGPDRSSTWT